MELEEGRGYNRLENQTDQGEQDSLDCNTCNIL